MTRISTLRSDLSSAEICRRNGWGPGTIIEGDPTPKDDRIFGEDAERIVLRITAVGDRSILAMRVGAAGEGEERWDLRTREWRPR